MSIDTSGGNPAHQLSELQLIFSAMAIMDVPLERAQSVATALHNAIISSGVRFAPATGEGLSGSDILEAVHSIAHGLDLVRGGLDQLMIARRAGAAERSDAEPYRRLQACILTLIATKAIPARLQNGITPEGLRDVMPTVEPHGFSDLWRSGWATLPVQVKQLAVEFDPTTVRRPTRRVDQNLVGFVGRVASIYESETGKRAASPDASGNLAEGWQAPFYRFFSYIWHAASTDPIPTARMLRSALKIWRLQSDDLDSPQSPE